MHGEHTPHHLNEEGTEGTNDHPLDQFPFEHNIETKTIGLDSKIHDLEITAKFIEELKNAKLEDSNMHPDDIARLREAPSEFPFDVDDPDFLFSLRTFLAVSNASEEVYNSFRNAALARHLQNTFLSYDQIKRRVQQITGIVPIAHDMCIDSCAAFTGPFRDLDQCPLCSEPRYQYTNGPHPKRIARRQYQTIPLGFLLQAFYRSPQNAERMQHRQKRTDEILDCLKDNDFEIDVYDDVYTGRDYLEAVASGKIKPDDIMLQLSLDGAQLC